MKSSLISIIVNQKFQLKLINVARKIFPNLNFLFYTLFDNKKEKINIVFYSPYKFQSCHILPVIQLFCESDSYHVYLVGDFKRDFTSATYFPSSKYLSLMKKYSLFITTEIIFPWKIKTKTIYFGHGVGPKLDYNSSSVFKNFDYCLCPCKPFYNMQSKINRNCIKIGLPLIDEPSSYSREMLINEFNLNDKLPSIIYAPSWHANTDVISDIEKIVNKLRKLKKFNVIISPHPHLMNPLYCGGVDFSGLFKEFNLNFYRDISTFELVKGVADIVISDISSILFESMAIRKKVVFDGNKDIYVQSSATDIYVEMKRHVPTIDWELNIESQLFEIYLDNELVCKQREYISNYIYNIGCAKNKLHEKLVEIASN